ncbi:MULTISPECIES: hypothetical protein [unclassified Nocardiopsis]|uniref:hypothetical protein n=1 Tax=unclassified Nocardiopsis TaxID=2649073 RepID=UPI001358F243|nr:MULTISPECIES: hypothetical protein [unclassified Nocardiopsis]
MACLLRDEVCAGGADVLVCDPCLTALTGALHEAPALLRLLAAQTGHSLARPLAEVPTRGTTEPAAPARVHMIDLGERLTDAIAEWSAITGRPPARTLPGMASACARLAAAPYRYLAALGGVASARATLRATRAARRALVPLVGVRRLTERCPQCGTKGLTQLTEPGPAVCAYCDAEVSLSFF